MKEYRGQREGDDVFVTVGFSPLNPRYDLWDYGSDRFNWGYDGEGPAQLALAILADCLGDDTEALRLHHEFKRAFLVNLDYESSWMQFDYQIRDICNDIKTQLQGQG